MARFSWVRSSVIAATIAAAASGCADSFNPPDTDRCFIQVALILPRSSTLNIGDTITLRAEFNQVSAECLPTDTTAKSLRWSIPSGDPLGVIDIDSLTAHVTARKSGITSVMVKGKYKEGYSAVGLAFVTVVAPPVTP